MQEVSLPALLEDCTPAQKLIVDRIVRQYVDAPPELLAKFATNSFSHYTGVCRAVNEATKTITNEDMEVYGRVTRKGISRDELLGMNPDLIKLQQKFDYARRVCKKPFKSFWHVAEDFHLHIHAGFEIERILRARVEDKDASFEVKELNEERLESFAPVFKELEGYSSYIAESNNGAVASEKFLKDTKAQLDKILGLIRNYLANRPDPQNPPAPG